MYQYKKRIEKSEDWGYDKQEFEDTQRLLNILLADFTDGQGKLKK